MLKKTRLPNKPAFGKNNGSKLAFRKNNGNSKDDKFNISNNGIKYTKKSKNHQNQENQKAKKRLSPKI